MSEEDCMIKVITKLDISGSLGWKIPGGTGWKGLVFGAGPIIGPSW